MHKPEAVMFQGDDEDLDEHDGTFEDQFESDTEIVSTNTNSGSGFWSNDRIGLPIVPVTIKDPVSKKEISLNALLDDGAQRTFLSAKIAEKLQLKGVCVSFQSQGVGGTTTSFDRTLETIVLIKGQGKDSKVNWEDVQVRVIPNVVGDLKATDWKKFKLQWPHLKNVPFPEITPESRVDMIIGVQNTGLMRALEADITGPKNGPIARRTPLGWVVFGQFNSNEATMSLLRDEINKFIEKNAYQMSLLIKDEDIYGARTYNVKTRDSNVLLCSESNWDEKLDFEEVWNKYGTQVEICLVQSIKDFDSGAAQFFSHSRSTGYGPGDDELTRSELNFFHSDLEHELRFVFDDVDDVFQLFSKQEVLDQDLNYLFEKQMEIERIPDDEEKALSQDNKYAQLIIDRSIKRLKNGQYQVSCLWKRGEPTLQNNFPLAYMRHKLFAGSKLMLNPDTKKEVVARIEEWVQEGHARKVPKSEERPEKAYYLPIFGVANMDRETTKVRVVADGRAEYKGRSLNGSMLAGPCMITDLMKPIIRFRRFPVAVTADVSRMFLQVRLEPKDRPYHRFLFTEKEGEEPEEYEFLVHCFGNAGSPTIAISVVRHFAKTKIDQCPRAVETVLESTYVDDTVDSFETVDEAERVVKFLRDEVYAPIVMKLRKFASNSTDLMKRLEQDHWAKNFELIGENQTMNMPTKQVLGVHWETETDVLSFPKGKFGFKIPEKTNKRAILKVTASIFDPVGMASPILVAARMLIQKCWILGLDWNDEVPREIQVPWEKWCSELENLASIQFPRVLIPTRSETKIKEMQLHTFSDASGDAYCSITYIRIEYEDGFIYVNFINAKTRLAPVQKPSIARLELEAAKMGALLLKVVRSVLQIEKIFMWSDSMNVLGWLRTPSKSLKMYVCRRVESILSNTNKEDWHYINTKENPADIGSRGASIEELSNSELWKLGPKFLRQSESHWPINSPKITLDDDGEKELKPVEEVFTHVLYEQSEKTNFKGPLLKLEDHSSWKKCMWQAKAVVKCIRIWQSKTVKKEVTVKPHDVYRDAENLLFRQIQIVSFPEEREELLKNNRVKIRSHLLPLRPYLDESGLIRCNSRIALAKVLDQDSKRPIILPKKNSIVAMLAKHHHERVLEHGGGHALLLNKLNKRFWIIEGKSTCKFVTSRCVECKRVSNQPMRQVQGCLPQYRIPSQKMAPFNHTILDAAGPFAVTQRRSTVKRYLIIFACMIYRAVHIEVVQDLSQDAFLMAFDRFTARRGIPSLVRSDNGTNFTGGSKVLLDLWSGWAEKTEAHNSDYGSIEWVFSSPKAPHTQGSIERVVGLVKEAFIRKMSNKKWAEEVLETVAVKIEGILNSRPLTYISTDPKDPRPLSPNSFLAPLTKREHGPIAEVDGTYLKKKWVQVNQTLSELWAHFVKEMVPTLHKNTVKNWDLPTRDVQVGDIVALLEEKERGRWPLARVVRADPDKDGKVRFADIVLAKLSDKSGQDESLGQKHRTRHVNKLMLLVPAELDQPVPAEAQASGQAQA